MCIGKQCALGKNVHIQAKNKNLTFCPEIITAITLYRVYTLRYFSRHACVCTHTHTHVYMHIYIYIYIYSLPEYYSYCFLTFSSQQSRTLHYINYRL